MHYAVPDCEIFHHRRVQHRGLACKRCRGWRYKQLQKPLSDAVLAWNGPILSSGGQPHGMTYVGETYPGNTAQVLVMVRSLDAGQLGLTIISPSSCEAVHGTKVNMGIPVVVHLATRNDWFTQDNSRRSLWEGCPGSGYSPTYTCSKTQDVGSTITHELGHVLGLAHPRQTDQHVNGTAPSTVMSLAKCAVANDQATMCQAGTPRDQGYTAPIGGLLTIGT